MHQQIIIFSLYLTKMLNIISIILLVALIAIIIVFIVLYVKKDNNIQKKTYSCTSDGGCIENPEGNGAFNDYETCYSHCKENQGVTVNPQTINYIYDTPTYIPRNRVYHYPFTYRRGYRYYKR